MSGSALFVLGLFLGAWFGLFVGGARYSVRRRRGSMRARRGGAA